MFDLSHQANTMQFPTTILILGNHRNALSVARRLGTQHRVVLGNSGGAGRVERSKFVAETWPLPDANSDRFPDALESLLQQLPDATVLFPIGDVELFALLRVPSVLEGRVRAVMPSPDIAAECLNKTANLELASKLQIPQVDYRHVEQLSELQQAVHEVGCPCIIKSDHQLSLAFGKKAYRVSDPDELESLIARGPEPEHGLIVQVRATGLRHNVYFAADNGRVVGAIEARVLRTTNYDGSGFTVESESVPLSDALLHSTEQLVEALGYHGIGNTQFLVDPQSGNISFLEISPRLGAAFAVTIPCEFDFVGAALALALGEPLRPEMLPRQYPAGRRLAWSFGDLQGLVLAARQGEVGTAQVGSWLYRITRSAIRADIHTTWSWRDPRPTLTIAASALGKLLRLPAH